MRVDSPLSQLPIAMSPVEAEVPTPVSSLLGSGERAEVVDHVVHAQELTGHVATAFVAEGGAAGVMGEASGGAVAMIEIGWHFAHLPQTSNENAILGAAFGHDGVRATASEPASRAAWGAVLTGVDRRPAELDALRRCIPREMRGTFDSALMRAREARVQEPDAFREAAQVYRTTMREWGDGRAAAVEGWTRTDRTAAFDEGSAQMRAELAGPRGREIRAAARSEKQEGLIDVRRGPVDERRYETDPFYRSGVEAGRRLDPTDLETRYRAIMREREAQTAAHVRRPA